MTSTILIHALQKVAAGRYRKVPRAQLTELEYDGLITLNDDQAPTMTPHGYRALDRS